MKTNNGMDQRKIKIKLNGYLTETSCKTIQELYQSLDLEGDVFIFNGYQIQKDAPLSEGDTINILKKGVFPPKEQLEALLAARNSPGLQEKFKNGRVAVAGLGGIGSHIAVMLARAGIGHLLLVDFDVVEPSNLNRQNYFIRHLGMAKTEALKEQLMEINPYLSIKTCQERVTEQNITSLFSQYSIVCEAFDQPFDKSLLVSSLLENFPNTWVIASSGMAGLEHANLIQTAHPFSHLYVCGDQKTEAKIGQGLMAPRVQICAGHQANMVLRLLAGKEEIVPE